MRCEETLRLLDAYVDAELDPSQALAVEAHLGECAACHGARQRLAALRAALRSEARYHRAPAALRAAVAAQIAQPAPRWTERLGRLQWVTRAAAYAAVAGLASAITLQLAVPSAQERATDAVVTSHTRSLMAQQIVDVPSSDQHTVKPWFNGKLDFSPPVKDLAAKGFPLIGGRIDYVDGQAVAAVVYQRRRHYIDVYIWPNQRGTVAPLREDAKRGFTVLGWSDREFTYFAVSDVDATELRQLVSELAAS